MNSSPLDELFEAAERRSVLSTVSFVLPHGPTVELNGPDPITDYARRYLGAWWPHSDRSGPRTDASLCVLEDSELANRMKDAVDQEGLPTDFYQRRAAKVVHTARGRIVADESGSVIGSDVRRKRAVLVSPAPDRSLACRIIRDLATSEVERSGWTLLHAAAVAKDGAGVLVVGAKGAGKTTASLALARAGWSIVSNDRTLLGRSAVGGWSLVSWPTTCNLGLELLHAMNWDQRLRAELERDPSIAQSQKGPVVDAIAAGATTAVVSGGREHKWHYLPEEMVAWHGVTLAPSADLRVVLAPLVDLSSDASGVRDAPVRGLTGIDLDTIDRARLFPDVLGVSPSPSPPAWPHPGDDYSELAVSLGRSVDRAADSLVRALKPLVG